MWRDVDMEWKNRSAYVFIKTKKGKSDYVWKQFQNWDNVIGTWVVTGGDYDVIVWFDATDWDTVHNCVQTIKGWTEVEHTSSHMVYNGHKTDRWWWEYPAGAWVLFQEDKFNETLKKLTRSIETFDAGEECKVVACFYHHVNWWVENFIHSDKSIDEIEATEDDNFFL